MNLKVTIRSVVRDFRPHLLAALFCYQLSATAKGAEKPVVYDHIQKNPDRNEEAALHKEFAAKFKVIDLTDTKGYVPGKVTKVPSAGPRPRDASGRIQVGRATAVFVLTADGKFLAPFIVRSTNSIFNRPLLDAVKTKWEGRPARLNGVPVSSVVGQEIIFDKPPSQRNSLGFDDSAAVDARGIKHLAKQDPDEVASWMEDVIKRVDPVSRNSDIKAERQSYATFRLMLDMKTGEVTNVIILKSTGHEVVDRDVRAALLQWRWAPGKWRSVDLPVTFGNPRVTSPGADYHPPALPSIPGGMGR